MSLKGLDCLIILKLSIEVNSRIISILIVVDHCSARRPSIASLRVTDGMDG